MKQYVSRNLVVLVNLAMLWALSGCFGETDFFKQDKSSEVKALELTPVKAGDGLYSASFAAGLTEDQILKVDDQDLGAAEVLIPSGALAISANITVQEGVSLATSSLQSELNLDSDTKVQSSSKAINISADSEISVTKPMTIALSLPASTNLNLSGSEQFLAVIYTVSKIEGGSSSIHKGAIPSSEIVIRDGKAVFSTYYFGTYQAVYLNKAIEVKKEIPVTEQILTKREEKKLPEVIWTIASPSIKEGLVTLDASLQNNQDLSRCMLFLDQDKEMPWDYAESIKAPGKYSIKSKEQWSGFTLYAKFECVENNGRVLLSSWSKDAVKIPVNNVQAPTEIVPEPVAPPIPPPVNTLASTISNLGILGPNKGLISGTATSSPHSLSKVKVAILNSGNRYFNAGTFVSDPEWIELSVSGSNVNWSIGDLAGQSMPDGNYTVLVKAVDSMNQEQTPESSTTFIWDSTAPIANFVMNGNASITNNSTLTLTLDNSSGVSEFRKADGTDCSAAGWTNYAGAISHTLPAGDGSKSVCLEVRDSALNASSTAIKSINLDATVPTSVFTMPATLGPESTGGLTTTISGTASDSGSGLAIVHVAIKNISTNKFFDGGSFGSSAIVWHAASGTGSWNFSLDDSLFLNGVDYQVSSRATDAATNEQTALTIKTFKWISNAPSADFVINGDNTYTNATTVTLVLNDATGVSEYRKANGADCSAAGWTTYSPPISHTLPGGDGTKTVCLQVRDSLSNVSTTSTDSILLDQTEPSSSINALSNLGPGSTAGENTIFSGTANDASSGVTGVQITVKNVATNQYLNSANFDSDDPVWIAATGTTAWSVNIADSVFSDTVVYEISSKATDAATNEETSFGSDSFTWNESAPSPAFVINSDDTYTNDPDVTLTLTDDSGVTEYRKADGSDCSAASWVPYSSGTIPHTLAPGDGLKEVCLEVRDMFLNSSSTATDTITLDTSNPTLTLSIQGNYVYTNLANVTLEISYSGDAAEMKFSSDSSCSSGSWGALTSSHIWTLNQNQTNTKYVQVKDFAGNLSTCEGISVTHDDVTPPALASFSAISGPFAGSIKIDLKLPPDVSDYDKIEIRRAEGSDVDCGDLIVKEFVGGFIASANIMVDDLHLKAGNQPYSYRACIHDKAGHVTFSNFVSAVSSTPYKIFTSSVAFSPNLQIPYSGGPAFYSGISGADHRCQVLAQTASLPGHWQALLSDQFNNAKDRLKFPEGELKSAGNTVVRTFSSGSFWTSLVFNPAPIYNESGNDLGAENYLVWTGTDPSGLKASYHCNNWTSSASNIQGLRGLANSTTNSWSNSSNPYCSSESNRLYCVSQDVPMLHDLGARMTSATSLEVAVHLNPVNNRGLGKVEIYYSPSAPAPTSCDGTLAEVGTILPNANGVFMNSIETITVSGVAANPEYYVIACLFNSKNLGQAFKSHAVQARSWKAIQVSSQSFNGNLGGIAGADLKCQEEFGARYRALIAADGIRYPGSSNWPLLPSMTYKRAGGTLIGTTDSNAKLVLDLTGPISDTSENAWTGMTTDFEPMSGKDCSGWTDGSSGSEGQKGITDSLDGSGFWYGPSDCSAMHKLYCVEY